MNKSLTDLTVRSLSPGTYWDTKIPAFGMRVGKNRRTWLIVRSKARVQTVLGHYPTLGVADARVEAKRLLTEKPIKRVTLTWQEARDQFIDDHYQDKRASTKKEMQRLLVKHFAALDHRRLADIEDRDIHQELKKLDHIPAEKLHAFRIARCFLKWCTRPPRRFIPHSPLEGYAEPGKDRIRTRTLSDAELKAVWEHCTGPHGTMTRLLILWGLRRGEVLCLRRDWIVDNCLIIPGQYTKNGRPHSMPLLPMATEILAGCHSPDQRHLSPYFFPGRLNHSAHQSDGGWDERHRELLKRSGTSDWSAHDLRRTFRSNLARFKVSREVAERLLNHAQPTLSETYDRHDYLDEKRDALAKLESFITSLMSAS